MTQLANKKEFNLIMHPIGYGLKLLNDNDDMKEFILAPLREYKNKFKKGDIIIFSAEIEKYENKNNWIKQYETFIKQTQKSGIKFTLISPTPVFQNVKEGGYLCQEEWFRPSWEISSLCFGEVKKSEWFAVNALSIAKIKQFLLANPKVSYIDAFSILCPDSYCKNHDQKKVNYKDERHLTSESSMKLKNAIETFIRSK